MTILVYDGSFEGWLTSVFVVYEYKIADPSIMHEKYRPQTLFGESREVISDKSKAERVYKKLKEKVSANSFQQLFKTFLSEEKGIEDVLLRYVQYVLRSKNIVDNDFSHPDVLYVQQMSRKVHREKHRMEAFVRFQLTKDQLYYSLIQPDFNVLPLISNHFKKRYADQRWLIYDTVRKYGLYYDLEKVEEVQIEFSDAVQGHSAESILDDREMLYQELWQQYFKSVNISARKNMKLHIQHMPRRYWKYLVEKHGSFNE